jgi:hypothetical protein
MSKLFKPSLDVSHICLGGEHEERWQHYFARLESHALGLLSKRLISRSD